MNRAKHQGRTIINAAFLTAIILTITCPPSAQAADSTISFATDGRQAEAEYLWQESSSVFTLEGVNRPIRNLDGQNAFVIYRFDVTGVQDATLRVNVLNSFALSVSNDGQLFTEIDRQAAAGMRNYGIKTYDLDQFLPSSFRYLYVKIEHGAVEQFNGGFGACIIAIELELQGLPDIAAAQVAQTATPIIIDAQFDEPDWQNAQPLSTLSDHLMMSMPRRAATFKICYDQNHIYVAAQCEQPNADQIQPTTLVNDSVITSDDCVELFLMPPTGPQYYHIAINLAGTIFDEQGEQGPASYNSQARIATRSDSDGWYLEAAIPIEPMRAQPLQPGQIWYAELYHHSAEYDQTAAWTCAEAAGFLARHRFGTLELTPPADQPLPAVNLTMQDNPTMGQNSVACSWTTDLDAGQYELQLTMLPVRSPYLSQELQNLEQMNPRTTVVPWPQNPNENSVTTQYLLDRFGTYHLLAQLHHRDTGQTVSRALLSQTITLQDLRPMEVTLQQPFVSTESELPIHIQLNLTNENLYGTSLNVTLTDASNQVITTLAPSVDQSQIDITLPIADLQPGSYKITFNLTDAEGAQITAIEKDLTKYVAPGTPRSVTIDENGVCYVDGEPTLPMGFMLGGATPEAAAAGYNVAVWSCEHGTLEDRANLPQAQEVGIMGILHICNYLRGNNDFEGIRTRVSQLKNEPGLFAWYLADEPEAYGDTPEILRRAYNIIKSIDPCHPVYVATNRPPMLRSYNGCADIIATDPYPVPMHSLSMVAAWTQATHDAARTHNQAAWVIPQGFAYNDIGGGGRTPTDSEFRTMIATALIHGVKGITWWPYSVPRRNYWDTMVTIAHDVRQIESWILFGTNVPDMPPGPQIQDNIHWRAFLYQNQVVTIMSNLSYDNPASINIPLPPGVTQYQEMFVENQEPLTAENSQAQITLNPTQSRVITFNLP
ncbi:MAG: hypothetical protein JW936_02420 [Sedimentisphaerales bacterium]|nr:hypothetical protein [Sedimentisphaerales bacterium]